MSTHWSDELVEMRACDGAFTWAREQPDAATAWSSCERGDWMLWYAGRRCGAMGGARHRLVVRAACACARRALAYVPAGEERPLLAIETTEAWCRGEATIEEVRQADAYASSAASYAARESELREMAEIVRNIIPMQEMTL